MPRRSLTLFFRLLVVLAVPLDAAGFSVLGPTFGTVREILENAPRWSATPGAFPTLADGIQVSVEPGPGMDEAALADLTARKIDEAMERQNRNAIRALTPAVAR